MVIGTIQDRTERYDLKNTVIPDLLLPFNENHWALLLIPGDFTLRGSVFARKNIVLPRQIALKFFNLTILY